MVDSNNGHLNLELLKKEFKSLKKEIGNFHREIERKSKKGENVVALVELEREKVKRAIHLVEEIHIYMDKESQKK